MRMLTMKIIPVGSTVSFSHPSKKKRISSRFKFKQDEAPSHFSLRAREWLRKHLPSRWMGPKEWTTQSPDLTPLDFYLKVYFKKKVYQYYHKAFDSLRTYLTNVIQSIQPDVLRTVFSNSFQKGYCNSFVLVPFTLPFPFPFLFPVPIPIPIPIPIPVPIPVPIPIPIPVPVPDRFRSRFLFSVPFQEFPFLTVPVPDRFRSRFLFSVKCLKNWIQI